MAEKNNIHVSEYLNGNFKDASSRIDIAVATEGDKRIGINVSVDGTKITHIPKGGEITGFLTAWRNTPGREQEGKAATIFCRTYGLGG